MKIANLGTYLPKQCGIATFSNDLRNSLLVNNVAVDIIAISDDAYEYDYPFEVKFNIRQTEKNDYRKAAHHINQCNDIEAVIIQHEYGIFGGLSGSYVLEIAKHLQKPYLVVTHTVLPQPTKEQKSILSQLCLHSSGTVCMTEQSKRLLTNLYGINEAKIEIIGHGVPFFAPQSSEELKSRYNLAGKQVISTFGLIGPGKGLELGIKAMAQVVETNPDALFLILGQTHPMLKRAEGEKYREMLEELITTLDLESHVLFVNKFLTDEELGEYLYLSDVYLSPYPNLDQAVSGTLTFAVGCGRAIVATAYAYAREVLKDNRGLLANKPHPEILAELINSILQDDELKKRLQVNAYELGKEWSWPSIGQKYARLLNNITNNLDTKKEDNKIHYARL